MKQTIYTAIDVNFQLENGRLFICLDLLIYSMSPWSILFKTEQFLIEDSWGDKTFINLYWFDYTGHETDYIHSN